MALVNSYVLLHVLEHAPGQPSMERIVTDPGFLAEVLRRFGADRLVQVLLAASRLSHNRVVAAVTGAVRRARVAGPSAGIRRSSPRSSWRALGDEDDPALVRLVARASTRSPRRSGLGRRRRT